MSFVVIIYSPDFAVLVLILAACGQRPPIETSILAPANESPTPFSNLQVDAAQTEQTQTPVPGAGMLKPPHYLLRPLRSRRRPPLHPLVQQTPDLYLKPTPVYPHRALPARVKIASAATADCFGAINGTVVADLNANGQAESGEPGVMGAKLFLYNTAGVVGLYTTGNGQFYFPGLVVGKYTLTAAPPVGYTPSGPPSYELDVKCDDTRTQNILLIVGTAKPTPTVTPTAVAKTQVTPIASKPVTSQPSKKPEGTSNFKPFTVAAVYDIAGCGSINSPGLWRLATSLSSQWDCIQINSDNVIFDCQGNSLNGTELNGYGVIVHQIGNVLSQRPARNIEIRNCKSSKHKYGIFIDTADNLYIHDNTLTDNFRDTDERNFGQFLGLAEGGGMRIGSTTNALIEGNRADGGASGFDVRNSSGVTVRGNIRERQYCLGRPLLQRPIQRNF